jgi:hypothetical protein
MLRPQFHRDLAALRADLQPGAVLDPADALADLQLAVAVRAARAREQAQLGSLTARLGSPFDGRATDWDALEARAEWADRVFALPLPVPLSEPVIQLLTTYSSARAAFVSGAGGALAERFQAALAKLDNELTFARSLFPDLDEGRTTNDQGARAEPSIRPSSFVFRPDPGLLLEHMGDLDSWWEFCELRRAAETLGIAA